MTRFRSPPVLLLLPLLVLLAPGCRRRPHPPTPPTPAEQEAAAQQLLSEVNQTLQAADAAIAEGRTNGVFNSVEALLADPRCADYRPQIFDRLLSLMIRGGDLSAVRRRVLRACDDPLLGARACGVLYEHYRGGGDVTNAEAWSAELLARPRLPANVLRAAFDWNVSDNVALHQDAVALATLAHGMQALPPADAVALLDRAVTALFDAGRLDSVEQALVVGDGLQPPPAAMTCLATTTRVHLRAARGEWAALTNDFARAVTALPDDQLSRLLRTVGAAAQKANQRGAADACAETILFGPAARSNTAAVAAAAAMWTENAMATDRAAVPGRMEALLRAQVPAAPIVALFLQNFYRFSEEPAILKELLPLGERLLPLADRAEDRDEIRTKLLDGCFLTHDYDRAIAMVEAGVPGPDHDAEWHTNALVKLKAHRALEQNRPREAVAFFREFMQLIEASKNAEIPDPVSKTSYPKETVLGRNAKRIGDILAGIPDASAASNAYAEARALYDRALEKAKDPDARKVIEADRAQVPAP